MSTWEVIGLMLMAAMGGYGFGIDAGRRESWK